MIGPSGAAPGGGVIDDTIVILDESVVSTSTGSPASPEVEAAVFSGSGSGQYLLSLRHAQLSNRYPVSSR